MALPARPELTAAQLQRLIDPLFRPPRNLQRLEGPASTVATPTAPAPTPAPRPTIQLQEPDDPPPYAVEQPHELPQVIPTPAKRYWPWYLAAGGILSVVVMLFWMRQPAVPALNPDFPGSVALDVGQPVPEFQAPLLMPLPETYGYSFGQGDMLGRPTVLLVWASWAEGSEAYARQLNLLRLLDWGALPVNFVGLSLDEDAEAARAFMNSDFVGWPHIMDRAEGVPEASQLSKLMGTAWAPAIHVFDRAGRLSYVGLEPEQVDQVLRQWLPVTEP